MRITIQRTPRSEVSIHGNSPDPQTNELDLGRVIDAIPGFVWSCFPDGDVEFCSQRWLEYTGTSLDEVMGEE